MRKRFRIYLFLIIAFSFLLGMPYHTLALEVTSISFIGTPGRATTDIIKIVLLVLAHLLLISLLFIKDSGKYKYYLIIFPLVFLPVYFWNAYVIYSVEPRLYSWLLPYGVAYFLAVSTYLRLANTSADND
ncbi:hypothetical protein DYU05_04915 [Mucilaginibacter terrenus]|uniref:Uncharacterized protein n=1 Tax=Mucilaginibacter terrenus TaxID=2482727 RepID=A0A3E2NVR6_9SPHI|nr:hypothetical protein [Mucilaginibacter terrenus]RFZ84950.1 hypothetical protein DYU05_04915 [Mucilaginibacter terrenus]